MKTIHAVFRWLYLEAGLRFLGRRRAACAVAVVTMALALGANTLVFSVTRAFTSSAFGVPEPERLYVVAPLRNLPGRGDVVFAEAYVNYARLREAQTSFADVAVFVQTNLSLSSGQEVRAVRGTRASASFFRTTGVHPQLGRAFTEDEEGPDAAPVAVLSHALWQSAYAGSAAVLGSTVLLDGVPHEIIGVMPPQFTHPLPTEVWLPFDLATPVAWTAITGARSLSMYGRLAEGVTEEAATAELEALTQLAIEADPGNRDYRYALRSVREFLVPGADRTLALVRGGALLLVLLGISNLASLLIAWGFERRQELTVRLALGAGTGRIMRMLVAQGLAVVAAGGVLGMLLAALVIPALRSLDLTPALAIYFAELRVDGAVMATTAAAIALAGLAAGLLPAWLAGRGGLSDALRSGSRAVTLSPAALTWQKGMVLLQASLSVVIVAAAALIIISFRNVNRVEAGYETGQRVVARIRLSSGEFAGQPARAAFGQRLLDNLEREGDLDTFAFTSTLPVGDILWGGRFYRHPSEAESDVEPTLAHFRRVSADYTAVMGIPLLRGRLFSAFDDADSEPVALVSAALAGRLWPGEDAVGKRLYRVLPGGVPPAPVLIVGVVGDVMDAGFTAPVGETVYMHWQQASIAQMSVVATSRGGPAAAFESIRRALRNTDPMLAAGDTEMLDTLVRQANALPRLQALLLLTFASVAVMMVVLGSYGVMTQLVSTREREFALRLLFGASPGALAGGVLAHAAALSIAGAAAGGIAVWLLQQGLQPLVFGIEPRSLPILAAACLFVLALAAAAAVPAALRVLRTDPRRATAQA